MQEELEELEKTDKVSSALQEYVPPLKKKINSIILLLML